jgi:hypothetical protein
VRCRAELQQGRFTPQYVDKLQQLGPLMTPSAVAYLRETLPAGDRQELEQLLEDIATVSGGWHLVEPSGEPADLGATTATAAQHTAPQAVGSTQLPPLKFRE